ncbi:ATP-binding cassette domain-containing protein [Amorphus orientalis]|uniref:ATP-binding protein Uup n=1 Tax=Amorphus orientalis TaxID=649198 RepID=A0AAE4ATK1_9HYPH|nr:ATP-binding cassette domain-containing protein [Amorphus orientalis]MDQ0317366.1 ATP-binding cassette subfamily F protein uup [Amorphus orientalis]
MAQPPILTLQDIRLTFGGMTLLDGAELALGPQERLCLVGRNGSGKSTLLKIAAGQIEADAGRRFLQPGATIRYLGQEPDLSGFATVRDYVDAGLAPGDAEHSGQIFIEALGLTGDEEPGRLSGGEARRAALARALAPEPDVLLLDEPTNHLDLPAIEWLEATLKARRGALVLISHDRRFLEALSNATVWLDRGSTRRLDRGFAHFEDWRDEVLAAEEKERHRLDQRIAQENEWLRYGVTARRKRNQGRLRKLAAMRQERRDLRGPTGTAKLATSEAGSSGKRVIAAESISKSFEGRPIVQDLSIEINRGDRLGIVGPNGAGKTTLINLLTTQLAPDTGVVRLGTALETVTLDQRRAALDPNETLWKTMTGGSGDTVMVGGEARHVAGYLKDFLFLPEQARSPVSALSGGERGRLMLARAFARPSNLMVLDEPTNDLDLETLDLLAELIADYSGTVLLVSHDRDFLDRTVTSVLASEGDGRWIEYAGGYTDMLSQRGSAPAKSVGKGEAKSAAPKASAPKPARAEPRRKLSFREKHDLETLPGRIETLEAEIARLQETLSDPELFSKKPDRFNAATAELEKASAERDAAEERWLELEMLREELENAR